MGESVGDEEGKWVGASLGESVGTCKTQFDQVS